MTLWVDLDEMSAFTLIPRTPPVPVFAWETDPTTGKKRPTTRQEVDPMTGLPVWELTVVATLDHFGQRKPTTLGLRAASPVAPAPITFVGGVE